MNGVIHKNEEADGPTIHINWGSVATVIVSVVTSIVVAAFAFAQRDGATQQRVADLEREIIELQARDITPGAERRISVLEARVTYSDRQFESLSATINNRFDRLEDLFSDHIKQTSERQR